MKPVSKSLLLIGGTGTTGAATARSLAARGVAFTVASRNPPAGGLSLDLAQPETLGLAASHETALLISGLGPDETSIVLAAVDALRAAGVGRFVYLSIMNLVAMREIPHFAAKIPIREALLADARSTVLEANFFQSNDRMCLPAILGAGVYPLPVGSAGIWSVAPADLGEAAANALTDPAWEGRALPLCGPERLTGDTLAANWAARLGRPVAYAGDDVAPFAAMVGQGIPDEAAAFRDWLRHDMATMMRVTQAMGCPATPHEVALSEALVGRPLTRHIDYIHSLEVPA